MKNIEKATNEGLKFLDSTEKKLHSILLKLYEILNNELLTKENTDNTTLESTISSLESFLVNADDEFYKIRKLLKP
jgi:hypothetical protein